LSCDGATGEPHSPACRYGILNPVPTRRTPETNIERNKLRLSLHLNIAACCLRTHDYESVIFHTTRALRTEPTNVKALFRRGCAHLALFNEKATSLDLALADLSRSKQIEPHNKEVAAKLAEAKARQKQVDGEAASVFSRMLKSDAALC